MVHVNPEIKRERIRAILPAVRELASSCHACGRACGVNRIGAGMGVCQAGLGDADHVRLQAALPHFGEEPMLVGKGGSGTVFFSYCCLRCVFCQNWQISHDGEGHNEHFLELAETFLNLRNRGVENINLVTPTQYILPILAGLEVACARGLDIPLVYNTNGYDSVELIRLLDGVADVWLPDLKYMAPEAAGRFSGAENYPETARAALREMYDQAGPLRLEKGIAAKGVIVRHLVLPNDLSGTFEFLLWLHDEKMMDLTISLMSQYSPQYHASRYPEISRPITEKEYQDVVAFAEKLSFEHILVQEMDSRAVFLPDFKREQPF